MLFAFRPGDGYTAPPRATAKGAPETLKLNMALVLLPVCRNTLTWLRSSWARFFVPFDDNITFHKVIKTGLYYCVRVLHVRAYWDSNDSVPAAGGKWSRTAQKIPCSQPGQLCAAQAQAPSPVNDPVKSQSRFPVGESPHGPTKESLQAGPYAQKGYCPSRWWAQGRCRLFSLGKVTGHCLSRNDS